MRRITAAIGSGIATLAMLVQSVTAGLRSDEPVAPPAMQPYLSPNDGPESEEIRRLFARHLRPASGLVGSNTGGAFQAGAFQRDAFDVER
jgi:hypothetical protein